jgi:hypothetical protein
MTRAPAYASSNGGTRSLILHGGNAFCWALGFVHVKKPSFDAGLRPWASETSRTIF